SIPSGVTSSIDIAATQADTTAPYISSLDASTNSNMGQKSTGYSMISPQLESSTDLYTHIGETSDQLSTTYFIPTEGIGYSLSDGFTFATVASSQNRNPISISNTNSEQNSIEYPTISLLSQSSANLQTFTGKTSNQLSTTYSSSAEGLGYSLSDGFTFVTVASSQNRNPISKSNTNSEQNSIEYPTISLLSQSSANLQTFTGKISNQLSTTYSSSAEGLGYSLSDGFTFVTVASSQNRNPISISNTNSEQNSIEYPTISLLSQSSANLQTFTGKISNQLSTTYSSSAEGLGYSLSDGFTFVTVASSQNRNPISISNTNSEQNSIEYPTISLLSQSSANLQTFTGKTSNQLSTTYSSSAEGLGYSLSDGFTFVTVASSQNRNPISISNTNSEQNSIEYPTISLLSQSSANLQTFTGKTSNQLSTTYSSSAEGLGYSLSDGFTFATVASSQNRNPISISNTNSEQNSIEYPTISLLSQSSANLQTFTGKTSNQLSTTYSSSAEGLGYSSSEETVFLTVTSSQNRYSTSALFSIMDSHSVNSFLIPEQTGSTAIQEILTSTKNALLNPTDSGSIYTSILSVKSIPTLSSTSSPSISVHTLNDQFTIDYASSIEATSATPNYFHDSSSAFNNSQTTIYPTNSTLVTPSVINTTSIAITIELPATFNANNIQLIVILCSGTSNNPSQNQPCQGTNISTTVQFQILPNQVIQINNLNPNTVYSIQVRSGQHVTAWLVRRTLGSAPAGISLPTWRADFSSQCIQFNWTQPRESGDDTVSYRLNINGLETSLLTQKYYQYCSQFGDKIIYYLTALNRFGNTDSSIAIIYIPASASFQPRLISSNTSCGYIGWPTLQQPSDTSNQGVYYQLIDPTRGQVRYNGTMTTTVLCIDNRRNAAIFNLQLIAILTNGVFISNTTSFQLAETVAALAVLTTLEIAGIVCGILLLLVMAVCAVYVYRKIHLNHQINQPLSTRKLYVDDIPLVEAQETAINFSLFSHRARSNNVSLEPIKESGEDIGPTEYGSDDNDIDENSDSFDAPPEVVEEIIAPVSSNRNSQPPSRSASIGSKLSKKSVNFNEEIRGNVTVTTVEMNGELYEIHEGEFSFDPNCSNGDDNIVGRPRSSSIIIDDMPPTLLQSSKSATETSPT
ncbi:hypothetical protein TrispH2_002388, partial [Trichoplax sp. H2]